MVSAWSLPKMVSAAVAAMDVVEALAAEDDVGPALAVDLVVGGAAENHVVVVAAEDLVVAAEAEVGRLEDVDHREVDLVDLAGNELRITGVLTVFT